MTPQHPLENNSEQKSYFARIARPGTGLGAAAYRQAVIATTGTLPSWCQRRKAARKAKAGSVE